MIRVRHFNRWEAKEKQPQHLRVVSCYPHPDAMKGIVMSFGPEEPSNGMSHAHFPAPISQPKQRSLQSQPKYKRASDRSPEEHRAEISRLEGVIAQRARRREDRETGADRWFV